MEIEALIKRMTEKKKEISKISHVESQNYIKERDKLYNINYQEIHEFIETNKKLEPQNTKDVFESLDILINTNREKNPQNEQDEIILNKYFSDELEQIKLENKMDKKK